MSRKPAERRSDQASTSGPSGLILGRHQRTSRRSIGFSAKSRREVPGAEDLGALITYGGDGHVITFAPTGTGKTAGPVICNALTHPGQLIVLDVKGEIYRVTARCRREMGQEVHVLDLRDEPEAAGSLNPLDLAARCGTEPATTARSFAAELVERGVDERDPFWSDWAETMITGGVAWLLADRPTEDRRLGRLFDLFTVDDASFELARLVDTKEVKNRAARAAFSGFLQLSERDTRPGVLATTLQHLRLFDSDLLLRLTDTTTFDIDALIAGAPMTVYIIVPPVRLTAYRPLLRAWLAGLMYALMERRTRPEHRTLLLCDEAAALGRMEAFLTAATLMRGWGVTIWSFWQNPAQLELYGSQARTLVDNAGVIQLFGARNRRMAQEFAALVGNIEADAIMALRPDEQLLMIEGTATERCGRLRYFEEPFLAGLYDANPMIPRDGREGQRR